jgi:hypothetical protein
LTSSIEKVQTLAFKDNTGTSGAKLFPNIASIVNESFYRYAERKYQ